MTEPIYPIKFSKKKKTYRFKSVGRKGIIPKVVKFTEIQDNIFNLGFGDFDEKSQSIDDKKVSDNGDMVKVLATVVSITELFLNENPDVWIYVEGSTPSRTRLYQIAINKFFESFILKFEIYGSVNGVYEPFQKNIQYESFLIKNLF
jgi:hypothetical protein